MTITLSVVWRYNEMSSWVSFIIVVHGGILHQGAVVMLFEDRVSLLFITITKYLRHPNFIRERLSWISG